MIENKIIDILMFELCPLKYQTKYCHVLSESFINDLHDIDKNILLLLDQKIDLQEKIIALWLLKSATMHLHYIIRFFHKYIKYLHRKNKLKAKFIDYSFKNEQSLIQKLFEVVDIMFQMKYILPMKKNVDLSIKKAFEKISTFQNHGHYLSFLSNHAMIHRIDDILIYLRYINKTIIFIYENAIEPVVHNVNYNVIKLEDDD